ADGWRDHRRSGGLVIDVRTDAIVAEGLSMPHSPRLHAGALWLLEAGTGFLTRVDRATGERTRVCFCPGYARGLCFAGPYAIVGLSRPRGSRTFSGLELEQNLAARGAEPRCGLVVVDTRTGEIAHWLRLDGAVE